MSEEKQLNNFKNIQEQVFWDLQKEIDRVNYLNGWSPTQEDLDNKWFIPAKIALIHSEATELLEGYRNNDFENQKEEIADIFIRLFDVCTNLGIWGIEKEILKKIKKNEKRGHKHGGKKI
jgi:NTP pyrophosphatase (non-canonical NTP hydrolase)